jgi:hypothetical protein
LVLTLLETGQSYTGTGQIKGETAADFNAAARGGA